MNTTNTSAANQKSIVASASGIHVIHEKSHTSAHYEYKPAPAQAFEQNNSTFHVEMNPIQASMFRRVMYGLTRYTPQQLACISEESKQVIREQHARATEALSKLKYERTYGSVDRLLNSIFGSHLTIGFVDVNPSRLPTLFDLGIRTREIVALFIAEELLPKNFYEIGPESVFR